jgi:hypothetical protein
VVPKLGAIYMGENEDAWCTTGLSSGMEHLGVMNGDKTADIEEGTIWPEYFRKIFGTIDF